MNIRIPSSYDTVPNTIQGLPGRIRKSYAGASLGGLLIAGSVCALVIALAIYLIFFNTSQPKKPPPPVVVTQQVMNKDLPVVEHTIGTVVSNATVQLTSRVEGQLLKAFFTEGQLVHAGDLLFQIDPKPYQAAYDSALASLATAKVKADRYERLLAQKAVAPQDADDAKAAYLVAKAAADTARLNLGYTSIRSPIGGKTGPILIQPGNQITASAGASGGVTTSTAPSSVLVVITQLQPIKISFSLPQTDLPRIQKRMTGHGMQVTLTQQGAVGSVPLTAMVDFVGNQVNDQSGTIELRATFDNVSGTLVPGQLVDVGVMLDTLKGATIVPHDAVNLGPNTSFVYVVKKGVAAMVPVKVDYDDGSIAAIEGKVRVGDTVIVDGQLKVAPGKPVTIAKPAPRQK